MRRSFPAHSVVGELAVRQVHGPHWSTTVALLLALLLKPCGLQRLERTQAATARLQPGLERFKRTQAEATTTLSR
ncbi:MAG: hypothetical protein LC749_21795, partial [Actinobacteria bacterium]|nr:hypothetical protein [Actinomycetota bacterium]